MNFGYHELILAYLPGILLLRVKQLDLCSCVHLLVLNMLTVRRPLYRGMAVLQRQLQIVFIIIMALSSSLPLFDQVLIKPPSCIP